jgi:hypothetical protein
MLGGVPPTLLLPADGVIEYRRAATLGCARCIAEFVTQVYPVTLRWPNEF